jgi:hypothetical protein
MISSQRFYDCVFHVSYRSTKERVSRYIGLTLAFFLTMLLPAQSFAELTQKHMGVFPGWGNATGVQAYKDFENWLGYHLSFAPDFINKSNWQEFEQSSHALFVKPTGWRTLSRVRLALSVPLNTGDDTVSAFTSAGVQKVKNGLIKVANGDFDARYRKVANDLIQAGFSDAIIRLGHEGDWLSWPWSFREGNHEEYIAAFRHVHGVMRSVPGAEFLFEYTSDGYFEQYGELGYPGDAYVDIMGKALYDRPPWETQERILTAHLDFAIRHGKPVSYPEMGLFPLGTGCPPGTKPEYCGKGDNPVFIQNIYNWLNSLPASGPGSLVYANYFNGPTGYKHNLDQYPKSKSKFKQLFGALPGGKTNPIITDTGSSPGSSININHVLILLLEGL